MKKLLALCVVVLTACPPVILKPTGDGGFAIVPQGVQADPGQAVKFVLQAAQGAPPAVTWTVTGGGTIAADGTFVAPGCATALPATITITASSLGTTQTTTLTVEDKVTGITISPTTIKLAPGQTQQFSATVKSTCFPAGMTQQMQIKRPKNGGTPEILAVVPKRN